MTARCRLLLGDCLRIAPTLTGIDAIVSDPPYGMRWRVDSTRFTGGRWAEAGNPGRGRSDYRAVAGDDKPFDPRPWMAYRKVVLFGANHFAARLPVGTTLVWLKKGDHLFGTFLSDAELAWMKGGHGVYCFRGNFGQMMRRKEAGGDRLDVHPTQKPVALMRWCIERLKLKPGATILDPYMGTGTTGVAAKELGFNFVGIESDPAYHAIATRRLKAARKASA